MQNMPPSTRRDFARIAIGAATLAPSPLAAAPGTYVKPKIRAITGYVAVDRPRFEERIQDALRILRPAKKFVQDGGYDVQTIRIVTQPFPEYTRGLSHDAALKFFRDYAEMAVQEGFSANIGPAMLRDTDDPSHAELLGEILSAGKSPNASLVIAGEDGIHWNALQAAAKLIKNVGDHSPDSAGNFGFAATAMLQPYGPFFPGAYHVGEGRRFAIGTEGANVVDQVFGETAGNAPLAEERLTSALSQHAIAIEKLAKQIEKETGWTFMGLDLTPAPLGNVSIGAAIEKFIGGKFGSSGTMTACAIITRAVQAAPVKRTGYSGLMVPVMEDNLLAQRWDEGTYGIDALLAYSAVCGTGLDTISLAGGITQRQIERILSDVAMLAFKWKKPLSARLLPAKGKSAGERTAFNDSRMRNTLIHETL